jgi:hypothetical protein
VAGSSGSIRCIPDRAPTVPELGSLRSHGAGAPGHRPGSQGPGWAGSSRVLHRRDLRSGEKGGRWVGKTKRGKGTKIMGIADGHGLPLAVCAERASPAEVKLATRTVAERFVADPPERLIGDQAYDSDRLDERMLEEYGTELIAPHRRGRRPDRLLRIVAFCAGTNADGKSNACLRGSITSDDWLSAGNTMLRTSWASCTWRARSFCSGIYEMAFKVCQVSTPSRHTQHLDLSFCALDQFL